MVPSAAGAVLHRLPRLHLSERSVRESGILRAHLQRIIIHSKVNPMKYYSLLFLSLAGSLMTLAPQLAQAVPIGVDGLVGAEWTGVTPRSIAAAPFAQPGVGVAY